MEHGGDAIGRRQGDKIGDAQGDIQGDGGFERLRRCIEIESRGAVKLLFSVDAGAISRYFSIRLLRLGACFWNLGLSSCFCFTLQTHASYSEHLDKQNSESDHESGLALALPVNQVDG